MRTKKFAALFSLILAAWASDLFASWDEITSYPVACSGIEEGRICKGGHWMALNRTTYEVLKEKQEVIHWLPGLSYPPQRETNCAVRNVENWRCSYSDN